ncbi:MULTISPECIES: GNAT family N-acetyltransferase [unclassified Nocardioides]|uniref:GNAT family N-acetyltransferase n=1 Tax=Nocardioides sp. URHA0032 TaxID=1380388 RepID=UPI0004915E15|nr:GNAT family protein [Nocardioides sp. URHA0032]
MLPDGYELRPLRIEDAEARAAAYDRNREHLAPWDPVRPERFFTVEGQREDIARQSADRDAGKRHPFLLWDDGAIAGQVAIDNVVRGMLQSATVGYWVDGDHLGRGLATAMVEHAAVEARRLGLHRLEAGTLVHNTRSQGVLRRAGFEEYGLARRFLYIGGEWQDHVLFQRILHDEPPGNPRAGNDVEQA